MKRIIYSNISLKNSIYLIIIYNARTSYIEKPNNENNGKYIEKNLSEGIIYCTVNLL